MKIIKSPAELTRIKTDIIKKMSEKEKLRIRVHMGTSGLASGAKEIYEFMKVELEKRNIDAAIIRTGDMGYSFAEPTIEVKLPGEAPVVFGNVDKLKADEIIEKYIKNRELVDGVLPSNFRTI
ncbi:MAG: (2Fe-2S) ferredoxin domain-containing protein [Bacteroidales bacterium]|jgi:NADP-reducing hydrogenase subunit HndB|nr:(2Fe-2S) ferredoxin domain-containing protein [Bacteroidales bacterium]